MPERLSPKPEGIALTQGFWGTSLSIMPLPAGPLPSDKRRILLTHPKYAQNAFPSSIR
jgi:hypothetical protein